MRSVTGLVPGPARGPALLLSLFLAAGPAAALDRSALRHDSRDLLYRSPGGAVPAGTPVTLRFRTARNEASSVTVFTWDEASRRTARHPMAAVRQDDRYHLWEVVLPAPAGIAVERYRFVVRLDENVVFYEDDPPRAGHEPDGGVGRAYDRSPDRGWTIVWHDPAFTTPAWAQGAVVYQVFPDRFANGDPSNDPGPASPIVHGLPALRKAWDERPEGSCRYYTATCCREDPRQRDFFGGDLEGLRQKLPDLADLGVDVVYLTPIFASTTNHKYHTDDYTVVDPAFGDEALFRRLAAEARALGIRLLLDGVFNHASSDSVYFDKAHRFATDGAYESKSSPWFSWFSFDGPWPDGYRRWLGVDALPVLTEAPAVRDFFWGPDGIAHRWLAAGASGWRLDAMDQKSHGFWQDFRRAVRARTPDALIVGEHWHDATDWLAGNELDAVMNYRFRNALIGFVNGDTVDANGRIGDLPPSAFDGALRAYMEQYPAATHGVLMNIVDSHDTERILWTLAPGRDRPDEKEAGPGYESAIRKLKLLSTLQMTLPGSPTVYYGDEAGLTGDAEPDSRRPYPWGRERTDLRAHYRSLMRQRHALSCLRTGAFDTLVADDGAGVFAFLRSDSACSVIVVANRSEEERVVALGVGYPQVRVGPVSAVVLQGSWKATPSSADPLAGWQAVEGRIPVAPIPAGDAPTAAPQVAWSSHAAIALRWAGGTQRVVRRRPGGAWAEVGSGSGAFVDADVERGGTYEYAFRGAESRATPPVTAERTIVKVTLSVEAPGSAPVYVAGSFQGWVANTTPMMRGGDGRWTHTFDARQGDRLEYKYTLGSWDVIEKGADLDELPARVVTVEPDASGAQLVLDRVLRWRDADPCLASR